MPLVCIIKLAEVSLDLISAPAVGSGVAFIVDAMSYAVYEPFELNCSMVFVPDTVYM